MVFNSFVFLIYFPTVFIIYWLLFISKNNQNIFLLFASYLFYGFWSWKFLLLLIANTILDYFYGFGVFSQNKNKAKFFLWLSIINNLGVLAFFKYYNFFASQFQLLGVSVGIKISPYILNIVLPIGISFYTFHGMSYVFDIYRKKQKPVTNFFEYSLFVSFFPLLVAGPIERANHLLPQIQKERKFNYYQSIEGSRLILWGLFKKMVIADNLAIQVDRVFENYNQLNGITLIVGLIYFSIQIYCDFSGYTDIALGSSKLLGFELLSNFKFPYFSRNLGEFWRRWHISLSSWFKDYLYIPLGGSQKGIARTILNTFVIFFVSGFWHGASWNFIVWGGIHAIGFIPSILSGKSKLYTKDTVATNQILPSLSDTFRIVCTFLFVTLAWLFFRLNTLDGALEYLQRIVSSIYDYPKQLLFEFEGKRQIIFVLLLLTADWYLRFNERSLRVPKNIFVRWSVYLLLMCIMVLYMNTDSSNFIYFQF